MVLGMNEMERKLFSATLKVEWLREEYGSDCDLVAAAELEASSNEKEKLEGLLKHIITYYEHQQTENAGLFRKLTEDLSVIQRERNLAKTNFEEAERELRKARDALHELDSPTPKGIPQSVLVQ